MEAMLPERNTAADNAGKAQMGADGKTSTMYSMDAESLGQFGRAS
jgi:hypothetical protein